MPAIEVRDLVKDYGPRRAVDRVTFSVEKGEVVGFLGPNGAGKTTTLRILTGFMPATGGTARVAGFDVFTQSMDARRRVGYLPENVPLYPEMRVVDFLWFRAGLKQVPFRDRAVRIRRALESVRIADVADRVIGHLSKGYRQRVGLADVLTHDPEILILDEPTVGLDPNQVREVRDLIKELGRDRTVLFSTHVIPWVEEVCQRVIVIARGRVVAQGTVEELQARLEGSALLTLRVRRPYAEAAAVVVGFPGVRAVENLTLDGAHGSHLRCLVDAPAVEPLKAALAGRLGDALDEARVGPPRLEDFFHEVTRGLGGQEEAVLASAAAPGAGGAA
jgi:gliding motility-associated transport system ATP-binding protein